KYDSRSNDRTPPLELWPKGSSRSNNSQPRSNDFGNNFSFSYILLDQATRLSYTVLLSIFNFLNSYT
ncbi:hypothetical protein GIB67_021544, partial [Kingdonia uniflora]